jgi:hypothetical protein
VKTFGLAAHLLGITRPAYLHANEQGEGVAVSVCWSLHGQWRL